LSCFLKTSRSWLARTFSGRAFHYTSFLEQVANSYEAFPLRRNKSKSKVIQGRWIWCQSKAHMWLPISP